MAQHKLEQFKVPLKEKNNIRKIMENILGYKVNNIKVERLALDCRKKGNPFFVCNAFYNTEETENISTKKLVKKNLSLPNEISIIGAGPAGLWAAYALLLCGHKVRLYEQGKKVEERYGDIRRFLKGGIFLKHSNIFFGEGGAGMFSDGKLNTRSRTEFSQAVLYDLIEMGASEEIAYLSKPHIGTDQLQFLLKKMRNKILELGGKIYFESELQDISVRDKSINSIKINNEWKSCEALVLACGHSARNIYEMLSAHGILLEGKSFAIGARIEHPQSFINETRFGRGVDYKLTGAADYTLTGKSAYSFCMCPGGVVVPCASEERSVCTNGMSYSRRNSPFANSALIVPVKIEKEDIKSGIALQRKLEKRAFEINGYSAVKQSAESFLNGGIICDLLPENIAKNLQTALHEFENKMPGFIKKGTLIAPETRTSSPVRIVRKENGESVSVNGIYAIGEGAGYAGGILTSAADGVRLAAFSV